MQVLAHSPLYGVSLTNLNIPSSLHSFHLNPCLEALHKIGKLDERDTIVCSESQVYHDGEGHEVRHPGRKKWRISIPNHAQPSFLRSSHTRSSSTFKDMAMKYRILISVGRLNISDISEAESLLQEFQHFGFFFVTICNDIVKLNFLHLSNSDKCLRREGLMQAKQHVTSFSCFLVLEANVVGHSSTDLVHRNIADDHNLSKLCDYCNFLTCQHRLVKRCHVDPKTTKKLCRSRQGPFSPGTMEKLKL